MTLTLPTPYAGNTARQRFSLELLLQQPVPGPDQLLATRNLLRDALSNVSPDQGRHCRPCQSQSVLITWTSQSPAIGATKNGNT